MNHHHRSGNGFETLRKRAEKVLETREFKPPEDAEPDFMRLLHEVDVQNVELGIQNGELRRATKELKESRNEYADLYRSAPVAIISLNEKGVIGQANDAAVQLFAGFSKFYVGTAFSSLITPKDRGIYYSYLENMVGNRTSASSELRLLADGGRVVHVQLNARAKHDFESKPQWHFGIVDISERKQMEATLRESEQKFRVLFENNPDAVFLTKPDGSVSDANPAAAAMLGWSQQELCKLGRSNILDSDDPELSAALQERQRTGRLKGRQLTAIRKSGERFPVEVDSVVLPGEPVRSFVILHDITERKRAEAALRESEIRYRTVGESIPYGIWQTDADGFCTYVSDSFLEMIGMTLAELRKFGWLHLLPPEDREPTQEHWLGCVRSGEDFQREHRFRAKDGTTRFVLAIGRPLRNDGGEITGWVGLNLDISDRKRAEMTLAASERENRELLETANSIIIRWDNRGKIRFINEYGLQFFGYSVGELVGRDVMTIVGRVEESSGRNLDTLVKDIVIHPGQYTHVSSENITKDGQTVRVVWTNKAILDEQGQVREILAIGNDITALNETEAALRKSRSQLESALASMTDAVFISDAQGRFIDFNDAFVTFHRFRNKDECLRTLAEYPDILDVFMADGKPAPLDQWAVPRALRGEAVTNAEYSLRRKDTGETWVGSYSFGPIRDKDGRIVGSVVVGRDITGQKRLEKALLASEKKYRELVIESAHSIIMRWDNQGVIRSVNEYGLNFFGYARDDFIGRDVATIVVEHTGKNFAALVKDSIIHPDRYTVFPSETTTKDGRTVWVAWTNRVITDEQGRVREILAIGNDITALKQAEKELRESEMRIKASLSEKEVLLKEIHHRVKNNMQVISSLLALQADELQDAAMRDVLLEVTHRVRSMALVHEKLYQSADLARIEFADYAQTLLNYLWRAQGSVGSDVRLTTHLEPLSLSVNTAIPCGLILNELVANALKHAFHGRDGGELAVSLHGGGQGAVRMSVRDNGCGLPPGFDWTRAPSLGLRLVQMLARQIRATVEVASEEGTEFTIIIEGPDI